MHLSNPLVRLSFGLVAVFALAMVVVAIGMNSDAPSATAAGPTPTKIANDGPIGGVTDVLVHGGNQVVGLFYCIGKTDHEINGIVGDNLPDPIKSSLQCSIDTPGQGETTETPAGWCDLAFACNQANNTADLIPGPPPPPPYSTLTPSKGYGFYYHDGDDPDGFCALSPCTVTRSCFPDIGSPTGLGPNLISVSVLFADATNPALHEADGTVSIYYNQSNARCKSGIPKGLADFADLPIHTWTVYDKAGTLTGVKAPWRPSANPGATDFDFDGDGCTDEDELSKNSTEKCGDDPQNPSDSFDANLVDLSGTYGIGVRVIRNDCTDAQCTGHVPGFYFSCIADLQHLANDNIIVRPYCYIDEPTIQINSEAYPGATGDGAAGGVPPGPQVAAYPNGRLNWAYGDVDEFHTVLTGTFDKGTNLLTLSGCFLDQDGFGGLGNVYVVATVSAHQLPGTVDVHAGESQANCLAGNPQNPASTNPMSLTKTDGGFKGKSLDQDNDGVPSSRELQDDSQCGRRDPYNGNDYYDVSVPRDGVIDLSNDILGVIQHYAPGGYVTGTPDVLGGIPDVTTVDNFDRPPSMTNALGGTWNRGSPDGVIDLSNDILGVILQYNPGGC